MIILTENNPKIDTKFFFVCNNFWSYLWIKKFVDKL